MPTSSHRADMILPTYGPAALQATRGQGVWLYDDQSRRYLDFTAGIGVNALGHCHPRLVGALTSQAGKLWHTSNLFAVEGQQLVGKLLVDNSFAQSVFFCNSGAEAVETGIKMARRFHHAKSNPRPTIITFHHAFHGRTLATIAASGQGKLLDGFDPITPGFIQVPFGDMAAVEAAISGDVGAVLIEPIQGEGGIHVAQTDFLQGLRQLTDRHGILLFLDEVQSGMGRTGKLFAHQWAGITPDIVAVAKGIGGGFPLGACLATMRAGSGMGRGSHGSTFGGNPLAMAVAQAVLTTINDTDFLAHVVTIGQALYERLEVIVADYQDMLVGVRGRGLMLGLVCRDPSDNGISNVDMVAQLRQHGLLSVGAGDNVVRLLPPLIIEAKHIDQAEHCLRAACQHWRIHKGEAS